ncbi:phosphoenolpyruvate--protein phosphotransferase [Paludicola sp. MB14-C6]|uniref:phosphoenolpyruvate--protein phosphotransferase n=1 Tax=Paludihabitans sp. MB14-C6 TaxID=3070656 RepID=UPI0027DB7E5A|nr:phosphoenolpyruvate--protein phosphotransferase [Paludicola sp. MB14-C6]WMJ23986.1 phosphoenolpyruvate--protein phosphotransferase [Paludicola sp. MB14-C6]
MIILKGKGVSSGIAIGKIHFCQRKQHVIKRIHTEDSQSQIVRFEQAKEKAITQLQALYEKALPEVGEANAAIFQIHQMMLEDLDYVDSVVNIIKMQQVNTEYAVATTADNFSNMFSQMDDEYMQGRAADVKDVSDRLIDILMNNKQAANTDNEPMIIAANDLAPSETVQMDKAKLLGFVTMEGSTYSHTAIIARTMNIPAVIGVGTALQEEYDGKLAVIDGQTGDIFIEPDEETLRLYETKKQQNLQHKLLLNELKDKENITLDGKKIKIYANIGSPSDVGEVLKNDAGGIGLFRSEFLFLEKNDYPTEEEQFTAYKSVAEIMSGKTVVIRTLDIGADKQVDYFNMEHEENPAMGYRAIRICLDRIEIFKTQLRALYRASAYGKIAIMFPMIISVEEVQSIKRIVEEVKSELKRDGISFDENIALGIMIETPAAALISDDLAKMVDFFSIGTNDLSQYTLAIDRQNCKLETLYNAHHKAILRLIKMVADNAHKNGIWVGICGELGADESLTETFLAMGIDELSVSPNKVLSIRKIVRETNVSSIKDQALTNVL